MNLKRPLGQTLGPNYNRKRSLRTVSCKNLNIAQNTEIPSPIITMTPVNEKRQHRYFEPQPVKPEKHAEGETKKEIIKNRIKNRLNKLLNERAGDITTPTNSKNSWKKQAMMSTHEVVSKSYIDSLQKSYVDYLNKKHQKESPKSLYQRQRTLPTQTPPPKPSDFSQSRTQQSQSMNNMNAHIQRNKKELEHLKTEIKIGNGYFRKTRPPSAFFVSGKKRPVTAGVGIVYNLRSYLLKKLEGEENHKVKFVISPKKDYLKHIIRNDRTVERKKDIPLKSVKKLMEKYQSGGDIRPWEQTDDTAEL